MPGSAKPHSTSERLSAYLSKLNPVPSFPEYTGPYKVGTVDVEIPVTELESPAPAPENAGEIETVSFRVFYPAQPDFKGKRITWLPAPQRHHLSAYIEFIGANSFLANAASFFPRHLHYTSIPVIKNAPLLEPETPNKRWPTAIFSHGLGGSRNAYSQITGSLASHGVVVICPEHRDGTAVTTFVRIPSAQDRYFLRDTRHVIKYRRIAHEARDEVYAARCDQLRIRLWELGLIHDAILAMDKGRKFRNLNRSTPSLDFFTNQLHVQEPGSIIFSGHSFGAATIVQFLKSVYYAGSPQLAEMKEPLYVSAPDSAIRKQITPKNLTILLDMWCFPLQAKSCQPLFDLPLPAYADVPSAPGGHGILAIESESFYDWTEHLHATARVLSPKPSETIVSPAAYTLPSGLKLPEPNFFVVHFSAHLNQSDFGLLFPWLTKRAFGSQEPERAIRLNLRGILQAFRANDIPIARTWLGDLVDGAHVSKLGALSDGSSSGDAKGPDDGIHDDKAIFDRAKMGGPVEAWSWVDIVGLGERADEVGKPSMTKLKGKTEAEAKEPEMAAEVEPQVSVTEAVGAVVKATAEVIA